MIINNENLRWVIANCSINISYFKRQLCRRHPVTETIPFR